MVIFGFRWTSWWKKIAILSIEPDRGHFSGKKKVILMKKKKKKEKEEKTKVHPMTPQIPTES